MEKAAPILALALSASACLAPADDTAESPAASSENIAETSAALTAGKPALDPEAATWIAENVPQWSVYLGGKGHDLHPGRDPWDSFTSVHYEDPRDSDLFAPVILVRRGDEGDPSRWIQLSLTQHWMKGDRYFDELIECGTLTMMDLVVVMSELAKHADSYMEPSPIHVLDAATPEALRELRHRSRFTCKDRNIPRLHAFAGMEQGPYGPPAPPGWVENPDTHTHGPGPMGSIDGHGHPLPPDITSTRPSLSQVPPRPSPPRTAAQNGVNPGDPEAKPSPFDTSYKPRPGEGKETFKCSGEVFYGYKAACVDFANKSVFEKTTRALADVMGHLGGAAREQIEKVGSAFRHHVFNDGKGPECNDACGYMALVGGNALGLGILVICVAATEGAGGAVCAKTVETLVAGTVAATSGGAYGLWINGYCTRNVCSEN